MLDFSKIFTHSEKLLSRFSNACFIPGSCVWYGGKMGGGHMCELQHEKKTKNISMVSSSKPT